MFIIVFFGIIGAVIWFAIIIILGNKQSNKEKLILKEMDKKIDDFENKAKIFDIKLRAEAEDKIKIL